MDFLLHDVQLNYKLIWRLDGFNGNVLNASLTISLARNTSASSINKLEVKFTTSGL